MSTLELSAAKRSVTGKKVRFLRRQGQTPANMYGHADESTPLLVDAKQMKSMLARTGTTDLISLKIEGEEAPTKVLVREVQKNAITDELLHVDFYKVSMTEKIKAEVPLVFVGDAPALKLKNTTLLHFIDSLHIEALPDALPHNLKVDLSVLKEIDQAIFVKDIPMGEGVTLLSGPEQMIAKVSEARRIEEEKPVEAKAEEAGEEGAEGAEGAEGKAEAAAGAEGKAEAAEGKPEAKSRKQ